MKPQWLLILGLVFLSGADANEDAVKKELKNLEGTWILTAVEFDGKEPDPQDVTSDARCEWVFGGNKYTYGQVGAMYKKREGFLRLDPSKKPKTFDVSPTEAFKPGETFYEIYELEGDTLKISSVNKESMKPEERPKEFKTAPKAGVVIMHWKRKP